MRRIYPLTLALTLAAAVALGATPAFAGRKAAAPKPKLTSDESDCKVFGEFFETVGKERDLLIPLTTVIGDMRKDGKDANVVEDIVCRVHYIYAHPEITPQKLRSIVEMDCLKERHLFANFRALGTDERACRVLGHTYYWIASDRDLSIPITMTIAKARNMVHNAPAVADQLEILVGEVYADPTISPAQWRDRNELSCMRAAARAAAHPWR
jgi:hypothetical protein